MSGFDFASIDINKIAGDMTREEIDAMVNDTITDEELEALGGSAEEQISLLRLRWQKIAASRRTWWKIKEIGSKIHDLGFSLKCKFWAVVDKFYDWNDLSLGKTLMVRCHRRWAKERCLNNACIVFDEHPSMPMECKACYEASGENVPHTVREQRRPTDAEREAYRRESLGLEEEPELEEECDE